MTKRNHRIVDWTRRGYPESESECGDTAKWEDQVWWGYWRQVGGEDVNPPDALFPSEKEALSLASLIGDHNDWHVGPVVLTIEARDNFEVPEETEDDK